MRQHSLLSVALFLGAVSAASASPVTYRVTVNSSSIAGTMGSLDFNFNPGPLVTQPASLRILNFVSDGSPHGVPQTFGDVSGGPLPAFLTFDNGGALNDYFTGFTFGSKITFDVSLFGPALASPDGTSKSGSAFAFSMFSDAAGTIPVLTSDPSGFAFTIAINLNGTSTVTSSSSATSLQVVPEPGSLMPIGAGLALWWCANCKLHCKITPRGP
jgi:hypothetical protein